MEQSELNEERVLQNSVIVCPRLFEQLAQTIRLVNVYDPYKAHIESKVIVLQNTGKIYIFLSYHNKVPSSHCCSEQYSER